MTCDVISKTPLESSSPIFHNTRKIYGIYEMTKKHQTQNLYHTAETQQGFFTAKQAKAAGFTEKNHPYHVRMGHWVREYRGIYRLATFPRPDRPDLTLWFLWSRNRQDVPQGVYSHQTALTLYDLSDVMPAKLHMTVPPSFRRSAPLPKTLVIHRAELSKDDVGKSLGVRVTKPLRTIADLLVEASVSDDLLRQALREALARGLVRREEIIKAPRLNSTVREKMKEFIGDLT